jgi:NTP pyrophosphatase (non-canonical NTP hydrolase)
MFIKDYQIKAVSTAIYPKESKIAALSYCGLKLNGEAGEVAEQIGKAIRDDGGRITKDRKDKLTKELGDVLWYLAALSAELDLDLDVVAYTNLRKLKGRKDRGTLQGSGDDR